MKLNIKILILAAGESSRLGQAKQLLHYQGKPLLIHTIDECLSANIGDVVVCLGAHHEVIRPFLKEGKYTVVLHPHWKNGLGSSIAYMMNHIDLTGIDGVIICLADQPFITDQILLKIYRKASSKSKPIIVSQYEKGQGPPVYFNSSLFTQLKELVGDQGAKPIVQEHLDRTEYILFEKGWMDIDTKEDLKYII